MRTNRILLPLLTAGLLAGSVPAQLFDLLRPAAGTDPRSGGAIRRSRVVRLDQNLLENARPGDGFRCELFPGAVFTVRIDEIDRTPNGARTWRGHLDGRAHSLVCFSADQQVCTGSVLLATSAFPRPIAIDPIPGGLHAVRELRYGMNNCEPQEIVETQSSVNGGCDDDPTIRILMVYGNGALAEAGGVSQIQTWMANQVNYLNAVMARSGVVTRFTIVSVKALNWTSVRSMSVELTRLRNQADGYYDDVHGWRDQEKGDLVCWVVGDHTNHGNTLGMAVRPTSLNSVVPAAGFSVVEYGQGDHVFTHEILHNLGCHHDPATIAGSSRPNPTLIFPFAKAKRDNQNTGFPLYLTTRYCTAVGYPTSTFPIIPMVSSPQLVFRNSSPLGNGPTLFIGSSTQDNRQVVNDPRVFQRVANYRLTVTQSPASITAQPTSRTVCTGSQLGVPVLSVRASSAVGYQWFKGTTEIAGANSSDLSLSNVAATDAGDYSCEVWGVCGRGGSIRSQVATLTVDPTCENREHTTTTAGAEFGRAIANVFDFNNDGYDDLLVGAPFGGSGSGLFEVLSGKDGARLRMIAAVNGGSRLGTAVAAARDYDRDGYDDALVGAPEFDNGRGRVLVMSGKTGSLQLIDGPTASSKFGTTVASGGDVNGDGYLDFLIGAPGDSKLLVYSGKTLRLMYTRRLTTSADVAADAAGDIDKDGFDDFLIGESRYDRNNGRLTIVSGRTGAFLVDKTGQGEELGYAVAGLGDVDGDGTPDYIVGAPGYSGGSLTRNGRVQVYSGRTHQLIREHVGTDDYQELGVTVAAAGAPERGTSPDYVLGARGNYAALIRGRDGAVLREASGRATGSFGLSVAALHSNGNPQANLAVGAPTGGGGSVYLLSTGDLNAQPPRVRVFGTACRTATGTLPHFQFTGRAAVGENVRLEVYAAPAATAATLWIDAVDQAFPMAGFGAPSCVAHAFPIVTAGLATGPDGTATLPVPVPNQSSLIGSRVIAQWAIRDVSANALGLITSTALDVQLGSR